MGVHNEYQTIPLVIDTTAAGAGALARYPVQLPGIWLVEKATLMPDIAVAAHATNGTTLTFQSGANEAGLTDRASHSTLSGAQGALTAGTAVDLTPTAAVEVDLGDLLALEKVDAASGQAFKGTLFVLLKRISG